MGMITSIRAPFPVAETPMTPAPEQRPPGLSAPGAAGPVAATQLPQAVQQMAPKRASNDPQLLEARMSAETSAAVAAEAARDAYIKASIAAGINPLPLS
jgi:hypothetical protein